MSFRDLVLANRSYRRFYQDHAISIETLRELVDLARQTPSGSNLQPLKYFLSADPETNARIFPQTLWAGYLKEWPGPEEGERPSAYIIILLDTELNKTPGADHGITAQTILLGAAELGLGGIMIGSIRREDLRKEFNIPERYEIPLIIALGKPKEQVMLEPMGEADDVKYWRDEGRVHHVPKRKLEDVIVKLD